MKNDNIDNKINNAPNNQAQKKRESIENKLLKNSNEDKPVDSKEDKQQNNLRNDKYNNENNGSGTEYANSQSTNESNNLSSNSDNIRNNLENENIKEKSNSENNLKNNFDHSLDIAVLNEINKACELSMNNISYLANMVNDKEMRKHLVSEYSQYSNIVLQVNQRFEKYGEVPDEASIKLKLIGMSSIRAELLRDKSNSHIAEIMIQGIIMGIIKCQKIINAELEIDKETMDLLNTFKNFQIQNIQKLYQFL